MNLRNRQLQQSYIKGYKPLKKSNEMKNKNASHETANTTTKKNSGKNLSDAPPPRNMFQDYKLSAKTFLKDSQL